MNADRDIAPRMAELLDRQAAALEKLLDCLAREREALQLRDAAALELASREKEQAVGRVSELETKRLALAPDLPAMERLAARAQVGARWERFLELTRRCREQNEANGRMIRRQQGRVSAALRLLRGEAGAGQVYGPDGATGSHRPRPPIASV